MAQFCPHCMQIVNGNPCPHCGGDLRVRSAPAQLPVGTVLEVGISRYQIGIALGQGGFGITYIAVDLRTGQRVAIKEYFPNLCAYRAEDHIRVRAAQGKEAMFLGGRTSFLKEAQMLASIGMKPGIVEIYNYFETNGTAYLVMEYLNGMTLKSIVSKQGRIPAEEFLPKLPPLISSLAQIHRQNVIHRDISPDNLMLEHGKVRLLDFGCARESVHGTDTLTIALKHGYAPIEQYTNHGQGPWTDIYALAGTIYFCITGKSPVRSTDRLLVDELVLPHKMGINLTRQQERALLRALSIQPRRRFQTMAEFHAALYAPDSEESIPLSNANLPEPVIPDSAVNDSLEVEVLPHNTKELHYIPPKKRLTHRQLVLTILVILAIFAAIGLCFAIPSFMEKTHVTADTAPAVIDVSSDQSAEQFRRERLTALHGSIWMTRAISNPAQYLLLMDLPS